MKKKSHQIRSLVKAIDNDPEDIESVLELADLFHGQKKYDLAQKWYETAILIDPLCSSAHNDLGLVLEEQEKLLEAIRSYRAAITVDNEFAEAHNNLGNLLHEQGNADEALKSYKRALRYDPKLAAAFNNIGNIKLEMGSQISAKKNFEKALKIDPQMVEACVNLGNFYKEKGNYQSSIKYYQKALEVNPDDESTKHNLNAILGNTTKSAPLSYVREIFDEYASEFDRHLVDELEYKIPSVIKQKIDKLIPQKKWSKGLDLGCGTGICGEVFSDRVKSIVGIDVSPKMLQMSKGKKVYEKLIMGEINEVLGDINENFDFFISTDVFIYVGDLDLIFSNVKKLGKKGGLFAFSTEHITTGSYLLLDSGRYAHSEIYVKDLLRFYGFDVLDFSLEGIRLEDGKWINGGVYIAEIGK